MYMEERAAEARAELMAEAKPLDASAAREASPSVEESGEPGTDSWPGGSSSPCE
jgi:hypothetical protein